METRDLQSLNNAVRLLLTQEATTEAIGRLKREVQRSPEPFVWSVVDINTKALQDQLPPGIKSGWIFVLKRDVPSGAHYHPNSVQHMVLLEGRGRSCIDGVWREMSSFGAPDAEPEDSWSIIPKNTPHEFFPQDIDMVVISFHTCLPEDLEEVACGTGQARHYEGPAGRSH